MNFKWTISLCTFALMTFGCKGFAQTEYRNMNCNDFEQEIARVDSVQLVDVRTEEEYKAGHLNNAILMNVKDSSYFNKALKTLTPKKTVAVYCRSGRRSAHAASILAEKGFRVINLDGGILAWQNAGKAVVTKDIPVPDTTGYIVYEGQPCPDFTVQLTDGRTVSLSQLRGKVVMLQFTASWCGVCRKEMPHIESEIWQRHKDDPDLVLIGIDRDEPIETVRKFAHTTGISYPLALDPGAKVYSRFALPESGITRNVLINRDGIIIHRTRLYNPEEFKALTEHIDSELKDRTK